jgi:class 3 adenylate cyclase/tetratricopeptide (TPR) repeat protein
VLNQAELPGLMPYVARLHAQWQRATPEEQHRRMEGTLVFADISGFTALTERLARKGSIGAEEMSEALNSVFSDILEPAHGEGADLVKWGGDAVLLLFTGDHHAAHACRGAHGMRERLRARGSLDTEAGTVRLRMSIGIHSGDFDFYLVGDPEQHRELLLSGPEVSHCVHLENSAGPGEIAVSLSTIARIGPGFAGKAVGEGMLLKGCPDPPRIVAVAAPESVDVRTLLPSEIRNHLLRGAADPEHRDIAVGFVKFSGTDALARDEGPEMVARALDEVIRNVYSASDQYGVTFFETDLDADGGKVMLAAGVPTSAGHHAERMLRATRLMLDRAGRLPLKVGVNYGHVFAGDFGPEFRRTYSIKGDPINLAARVMAKAEPGQLLATLECVRRSETTFRTEVLNPFMVKGKAQAVQAISIGEVVESPRDRRSHASLLVGRGAEVELLEAAVDEIDRGRGQVIEIVGPPGIGKSRLLAEATRLAHGRSVHSVQSVEYDASTPYHLFWVLLHNVVQLRVGAPDDEVVPAFAEQVRRVAPELMEWFPLLCTPLQRDVPDTERTRGLEEQFRRRRTEEVLAELLYRLLPDPTVLIFDDVQYLDGASAGVLHRLVSGLAGRPMLVVLGRHPGESGWVSADGEPTTTIELRPLADADCLRMVRAADIEHPLPPQVAEALTAKAGGNPLFLQSLLKEVGPDGDISRLPDTVADLITIQIDRLPPEDRQVLRRASVLGAGFDLAQLSLLFDAPPGDAALARLGEFLNVEHGQRWATFRHELIREVAYEGLPFRKRRELHARVAFALEHAGGEFGSRPELLSMHFFHAHRFHEAWRYSRRAGDLAKKKYAHSDAVGQYLRAIDSARRLPAPIVPRFQLGLTYESLADSWFTIGLVEPSTRAYRQAHRLFRDHPVEGARVASKQARTEQRLRRIPQSLRRLSRELQGLEGAVDPALAGARSLLLTRYTIGRLSQRRYDEAIACGLRAVEEGVQSGDDDALGQAYTTLHVIHLTCRRAMLQPWGELALEAHGRAGNQAGEAHCINNLAFEAFNEHRWSDAEGNFARAARAFHSLGDTANEGNAICNRAEVLINQGRYQEAEPLLEDALVDARVSSDDELVALALRQLGRSHLRNGKVAESGDFLDQSRALFLAIGEEDELPALDLIGAEARLFSGESAAVLELTDRLLAGEDTAELEPGIRWVRGFARLELGDRTAAQSEFRAGRVAAEAADDRFAQAVNLLGLAAADGGAPALTSAATALLDELGVVALPRGLRSAGMAGG